MTDDHYLSVGSDNLVVDSAKVPYCCVAIQVTSRSCTGSGRPALNAMAVR